LAVLEVYLEGFWRYGAWFLASFRWRLKIWEIAVVVDEAGKSSGLGVIFYAEFEFIIRLGPSPTVIAFPVG